MALSSPEQIAASQKASLDVFFGLTGKVFEGVEKGSVAIRRKANHPCYNKDYL
ncbi:hypothetical protein PMI06_008864 [Burkholderia sp. BT03]|nr:hypothetical protein PMI06_008864 [Burkholderia sp. BT03]SKC53712.1 hypothetical protein SAMN06266956_0611 [Paraburkholderia hospita]